MILVGKSKLALIVVIGAGGRFLGGMAGVGRAVILIRLTVAWLGLSQRQPQGNSLWVIVVTAAAGAARNAISTPIDLRIAAAASVVGSGGALALPTQALEILFPVLLIYFAQRVLGVQRWMVRKLGGRDEYS